MTNNETVSSAPRSLFTALRAARTEKTLESLKALQAAIEGIGWGQCGAAFITRASAIGRTFPRTLTLWVNGRKAAVVTQHGQHHPRNWIEILDRSNAEEEFLRAKAKRKAYAKAYAEARAALIRDLIAHEPPRRTSFEGWTFSDGQEGGAYAHDRFPLYVGARAYRAAEQAAGGILATTEEERDREFLGETVEKRLYRRAHA